MNSLDSDKLRLTDFMDLPTLQEIQDSFAAVANVKATITDADGKVLTQITPTTEFLRRQRVIEQAEDAHGTAPQKEGREYVAPIIVNDQRLGTIRMAANGNTRKAVYLTAKQNPLIKPTTINILMSFVSSHT